MKRHQGMCKVSPGIYLDLSNWGLLRIGKDIPVLPGTSEMEYIRVPSWLVVLIAPPAGLALVMLLPFIGIAGAIGLSLYKVGRQVLEYLPQGPRHIPRRIDEAAKN